MSYIVQRNNRLYVVAYNGHDPITGGERCRWHPAGSDPGDAEEMRRRIDRERLRPSCAASLGGFMSTTWLATKGTLTRPLRTCIGGPCFDWSVRETVRRSA